MAQQEASTSLTRVNATYKFLEVQQPIVEKWCTSGVRADALVRITVGELRKNERLAECTQESVYAALLSCAVTGLIPGAHSGEAYIIPYWNSSKNCREARFQAGWKGLVKQAKRAGGTKMIRAEAVHTNDRFHIDLGVANSIEHSPFLQGARGPVIGAYAWATLLDGSRQIEWVSLEDLEKIEKFAQAKSPSSTVWKDWREQMQRKTAIRRLCKFLPVGDDYYRGIELDDAIDDASRVIEILDGATEGAASKVGVRDARSFAQVPAAPIAGELPPAETPAAPPPQTTRPANRSRNNAKPPIDVPANDSPPAAQRGVIHNSDGSQQVGGVYVAPNGTPHSSKPANTSPRPAPAATAPASAPRGAAPAETTPPPASPATESGSCGDSSDEIEDSSGSDGSDESSTDPNGPGDDSFPPFGEEEPAPARSLQGFLEWLKTVKTRPGLRGEEAQRWIAWSKEVMTPDSAEAATMRKAANDRWAELPV